MLARCGRAPGSRHHTLGLGWERSHSRIAALRQGDDKVRRSRNNKDSSSHSSRIPGSHFFPTKPLKISASASERASLIRKSSRSLVMAAKASSNSSSRSCRRWRYRRAASVLRSRFRLRESLVSSGESEITGETGTGLACGMFGLVFLDERTVVVTLGGGVGWAMPFQASWWW